MNWRTDELWRMGACEWSEGGQEFAGLDDLSAVRRCVQPALQDPSGLWPAAASGLLRRASDEGLSQRDGLAGAGNRMLPGADAMKEGWLRNPDDGWTYRFQRDEKSWVRDPRVFVDKGREMPDGSPALLKTRQYVSRELAEGMWKDLVRQGWQKVPAVWGADAEP